MQLDFFFFDQTRASNSCGQESRLKDYFARTLDYVYALIKAVCDKLLMNKFIRQNFGRSLTLKNFRS